MKRSLCMLFWLLGLPWRILVVLTGTGFAIMFGPFYLFEEIHQWACKGKKINFEPLQDFSRLWTVYLVHGDDDTTPRSRT